MLTVFLAQSLPPLVQAAIPLALGVYTSLVGYGIVQFTEGKKGSHVQRMRSTYQVGGPLLLIAGLAMLVRAIWFA